MNINNILRIFLLYQIIFSPQVKRSVISSNTHGIYKLLYEWILGN